MIMKSYLKGAFFLSLASIVSIFNDITVKLIDLSSNDIMFLRFFFATLILIPFTFFYKIKTDKKSLRNHGIRALIFGLSMFFFTTALKTLPIALVNAVNFSIPIWVVLFACIFLKEPWNGRFLATCIGIIGVLITCIPIWKNANISQAILLLTGAMGFASLDVFNKHLLNKDESMVMMLLGSSFGISLLYLPFFSWNLNSVSLMPFIWLALGSNLILYFILKAWESCDISAIQPIKYIEFPIAIYFGKVMFQETPSIYIFIGLAVLVFGLVINAKREISKK